jgi:hypothetical protein
MEVIFQLRISPEKEDANNRSGAMHIIHLERESISFILHIDVIKKNILQKKTTTTNRHMKFKRELRK